MAEEPDLLITAGFSDAKLVAEANRVVAFYKRKGEEAQKAFQDAQGRVTNTEAARAHTRELDRLSRAYDPVYRASKAYEAEVERLNLALKVGAVTQGQYAAEVRKAAVQLQTARGVTQQVGNGLGRNFQMQVQNAAFQIGDFAVQVGSGTSASRAFAQQMPQLLGGFGVLGAVAGAVVAVAAPLAASLLGSSVSAEDLGKRIDKLNGLLGDYRDAVDNALLPMEELWKKFGAGSEAARETYAALLDIQRLEYLQGMRTTVDSLGESLTEAQTLLARYQEAEARIGKGMTNEEAVGLMVGAAADLDRALGLSVAEAERLVAALDRVKRAREADDPIALANAAREYGRAIVEAYERGADIPPQLLEAAKSANELSNNAREFGHMMGDAALATTDAAAAADQAARATADWVAQMAAVRAEIGAIVSSLASIGGGMIQNAGRFVELRALQEGKSVAEAARERQRAQMQAEFDAREAAAGSLIGRVLIRGERAIAEQGVALDAQLDAAREAARKADQEARKAAKSGGGGGKGRQQRDKPGLLDSADRQLQALEREITLIGKSTAEVARARAAWAMLDEAKKQGIPITDAVNAQIEAQADAVGKLTEQLEAGQLRQQQFEQAVDGIADAFANALVAGESLRKGLAQVFAGIASDLMKSGIHKLLSQLIGNFSGGGDPLTSALVAIGLPARASGGPVTAGRPYMVGERGPEPFVPAVNGRILSVAQAQAAMRAGGGGGATGRVEIVLHAPEGFTATQMGQVEGIAVRVTGAGIGEFNRALPARLQQINANPRFGR